MAGFFARSKDANSDMRSRQTVVERARYLDCVSDVARAFHSVMLGGVVGSGIRYAVPKRSTRLDYTGSGLEERWADIASTTWFDARGIKTFTQFEELVFRTFLVSGECWLFRMGHGWIAKEPDCIRTPKAFGKVDNFVELPNGNIIIDGIELEDGRPVACYVCDSSKGEETYDRAEYMGEDGLPAVLHVFMQERPDQVRGLPLVAPIISQIWSCYAYGESETQMAILQTNMSLIITTNTNPTINPFAGLTVRDLDAPLVPPVEGEKAEPSKDFAWVPPMGDTGLFGIVDKAHYIKPGQTRHLSDGEDIKFVSPTSPHTGFIQFCEYQIRMMGAAIGIPEQVLSGRFDANFSAVKGACSAFNHTVRRYRSVLIEQFLRPVFRVFLSEIVSDPEIADLIAFESQWLPNDSPLTLDPNKEIDFYLRAIEAGLITRDEAAEALFGHKANGEVVNAGT
jgi:lambda family phage portal protein